MLPIQIILVILAVFSLIATIHYFLKNKLEKPSFLLFSFIWICIIVVGIWPDLISKLANKVGITRGVDLLIYSSIIALFFIIFNLYAKIEKLDQENGKIVSEVALLHPKKGNKSK